VIHKYCCDNVLPLSDTADQAIEKALDLSNRSERPNTVRLYQFESLDGDDWKMYRISEVQDINVKEWLVRKAGDTR
jgi:hypothetical protein